MSNLSEDVRSMIENIAKYENIIDYVISSKEDEFSGENFSSKIIRVALQDSLANKLLNLIVKVALPQRDLREKIPLNSLFTTEINAYKIVIPVLNKIQEDSNIPEVERFKFSDFYAGSNEEFKELLIFKDMSAAGFLMQDKCGQINYDLAEVVCKRLAVFHATSFASRKKDPECFANLSGYVNRTTNYPASIVTIIEKMRQSISKSLDCATMKKKFEDGCGDIATKLEWILDSAKTEPYNVICHGDCWMNNMLFKFSGDSVIDVVFIDLQVIRLAPPVIDLVFFIFITTDQAFRQKYFKTLLETYYETLSSSVHKMEFDLKEFYPRNVFDQQIKQFSVFGLFIALCSIPFFKKSKKVDDLDTITSNISNESQDVVLDDTAITRLKGIIDDMITFNLL